MGKWKKRAKNNNKETDIVLTSKEEQDLLAKLSDIGEKRKQNRSRHSHANSVVIYFMKKKQKTDVFRIHENVKYCGELFTSSVKDAVKDRQKRGKVPRKTRYDSYMQWALCLMKNQVGYIDGEKPHYGYPAEVLSFIRSLVPGDIKGEIKDDAYKVDLETFCDALQIPKK